MERPRTLSELKASGYRVEPVKQEMRRNLIRKLRAGEPLFPGIVGYDETVLPQVQNAILSRHDLLFLGLRGQAKTRMLRQLVQLLDDAVPIVAGSETNDDPFAPDVEEAPWRLLPGTGTDTAPAPRARDEDDDLEDDEDDDEDDDDEEDDLEDEDLDEDFEDEDFDDEDFDDEDLDDLDEEEEFDDLDEDDDLDDDDEDEDDEEEAADEDV